MDIKNLTRFQKPGFLINDRSESKTIFQANNLNQFHQVKHGYFGRTGGISQGHFHSLNVGFKKNDDQDNVIENRKIISQHFSIPQANLITLSQQHGHKVIEVDDITSTILEADALITSNNQIMIGVLTADCLPVLMYAPDINYIAAVHAGRRGLQSGIIENTLEALALKGAQLNQLVVSIGPAIHQQSYEVDQEIYQEFQNNHPQFLSYFQHQLKNNKYLLDLVGIAKSILLSNGISNIEQIMIDTYQHPQTFFSCRYAQHFCHGQFGNQISAIRLA